MTGKQQKQKYFLVPETKLNELAVMLKRLPLEISLAPWNKLIEIVDQHEFNGPLPKAKKAPKGKKSS